MVELASFRMNRAVESVEETRATTVMATPLAPWEGDLLSRLRSLVVTAGSEFGTPWSEVNAQAQEMALGVLASWGPELRTLVLDPVFASPTADVPEALGRLLRLDRELAARGDLVTPDDLAALIGDLQVGVLPPEAETRPLWDQFVELLLAALLLPDEGPLAARAQRLVLVAALVLRPIQRRTDPDTPDVVHDRLHRTTPTLPSPPFPQVLPADRVELVRQATVGDLFVVRSEWRCYRAAEIADITSVLPHEKLEHSVLAIDEREITSSEVTETTTTEERSQETTDRTELSVETQNQVDLAIRANAQVDVSSTAGTSKIDATVGGSVDFSRSEAMRRATRVAREAVSRAAVTVARRTREERVERTLTRTEVRDARILDNTDDAPVRGLSRWVERVDRYQVVRYPDRLQLEFQLPEPGNALDRLLHEPPPSLVPDPGEFTVTVESITRDSWRTLVDDAGALGVQPPPEQTVWVATSLTAEATGLPDAGAKASNGPTAKADAELSLPAGYRATHVRGGIRGVPAVATWAREQTQHNGFGEVLGYHAVWLVLEVAGEVVTMFWNPDDATLSSHGGNAVMRVDNPSIQLREAIGQAGLDTAVTARLTDRTTLAASAAGASSMTAWASLECTLTDEAFQRWQVSVHDALLAEHQNRERDFREEQERLATTHGGLRERSPAAHAALIRDELKRQIVSWLCRESPFGGRPATLAATPPADPDDGVRRAEHPDVARALAAAPVIQFLEQAFEWQNLVYVCHPYYWADPTTWDRRRRVEAADPALAQFLAAGSARVVVPARPGFGAAVVHWLLYRQPWSGDQAPMPGDTTFVSVAQEIHDQLVPPEDGEPGESWEAALPTAFRWLDTTTELPHNPRRTLGLPPHEPAVVLCPDPEDDGPDGHSDGG